MKKYILILLVAAISLAVQSQDVWSQIGADINGEAPGDESGNSVSMSADGSIVAIGAYHNDGSAINGGQVRIYENIAGVWTQIGSDLDGQNINDQFGSSVSLSADGSIVAIGAAYSGGNAYVEIYENIAGTWTQLGSTINGAGEYFGASVSLSADGTVVVIGAFGAGMSEQGRVAVYEYSGGTWVQIGSDIMGEAPQDKFGSKVSISDDGTIIAAGAPENDGYGMDAGHVRVFQNVAGSWVQIGSDIDGETSGTCSGSSVSLSGDGSSVAIGAIYNLDHHARVFRNVAGTWTQVGSSFDAGDGAGGCSISLNYDGSIVAVGACENDWGENNAGMVTVYQDVAGVWTQVGYYILGYEDNENSGYAVSLSDDGLTLAVGANRNDGSTSDEGEVRVYSLCGTTSNIVETACDSYTSPSGNYTWTTTGMYIDTITNVAGCDSVINIDLTINTSASILTHPTDTSMCVGQGMFYSVDSIGTSVNFQWQIDGVDIPGETQQSYFIPNVSLANDGMITCELSNLCNTIETNPAALNVVSLGVNAGTDQIFCNDTAVQLNAIPSSNHPTESGVYTFEWTPGADLNDPNIQDPIAQPLMSTDYVVTITDELGCSATDNVYLDSRTPVQIDTQPVSINGCLNGTEMFLLAASGTTPITYQWKKDGMDIPSATFPDYMVSPMDPSDEGIYTCEVSNYCRTLTTDDAELKVIEVLLEAGENERICLADYIQLSANVTSNYPTESGVITYNWSPSTGLNDASISDPQASPTQTTHYSLTVTDEVGCEAYDDLEVLVQTPYQNQQLCLVTVDPTVGKNKIQWLANESAGTATFLIQKAVGVDTYSPIGSVNIGEAYEFIDYASDPSSHSDIYKIQVLDTCGSLSHIDSCVYHKTINLTLSNVGSTMALNWEPYEVEDDSFIPDKYYIYRGDDEYSMELIDSVIGLVQSYNDNDVYEVYHYMVGAVRSDCSPGAKSGDYTLFSNREDNEDIINSMKELSYLPLNIYPNPADDIVYINIPEQEKGEVELRITDVTGKITKNLKLNTKNYKLDVSSLSPGMYFIEIRGLNNYKAKLIVQ